MPHPVGIVLHADTVIGANCVIYQGVTIGARGNDPSAPVIGSGVVVWPNAIIIGGIVIGDQAEIGPHALVLDDVPAGAIIFAPKAAT